MTGTTGGGDPGWGKPVRRFLPLALMPMLVVNRSSGGEPPILTLRTAFLAFVGGLFGFLIVLLLLFPLTSDGPTDPVVYALVGIGPFTLLAVPWARRRLVDTCAPPAELAEVYRTTMFLSIAFVESAALFGFVASFLADAAWPYVVGFAVALVGFAAIAPTDGRLRGLDDALARRGCHPSLRAGILDPAADLGGDDVT